MVNGIMSRSYLERSSQNIASFVSSMDRIIALTVTIQKEFFTQLYKDHPDFRNELNTLLWPQDPLNDLQMAASQFRNAVSIWGATRDSLKEPYVGEMQLLVAWTRVKLN